MGYNRFVAPPARRSFRMMFFPISHAHVNPIYLIVVGFVIGVLGGFFGVGGSFIAGPALRLAGIDWNFAVGTDLAHIVGKSVVAAKRHRALGNVDLRLGFMISLPQSGVTISLWIILLVAFVGGLCSGFLGGGAGYIRMPSMVYILGIPTHLAVGTDLFEIIISASYGTFSHAIKGNVDILIALVMHTGAAIGAQLGAISTQYFAGPKIRLAFVPLPMIGAAIVIYTMFTGHKL